ncbi:hypothetical protein LQW54_000170 [Pestalotiopsis sp. IQ-011]
MLDGCTPHCIAFVLAGVLTVFLASVIYVIARVYCQRLRTKKDDVHRYPDDNKTDFTTREQDKECELEERAARLPSISNYLEMHMAAPARIVIMTLIRVEFRVGILICTTWPSARKRYPNRVWDRDFRSPDRDAAVACTLDLSDKACVEDV